MASSTVELQEAFTRIGQYEGAHQVLDTKWEDFLTRNFQGFDTSAKIDAISQKLGTKVVLDEVCGSSLTLFEAVEDIERRNGSGEVLSYGLTASTDYLAQPVSDFLKQQVLESGSITPESYHRVELLLGGVGVNAANGHHRYTPLGNLIRFIKADVHSLDTVFPEQRFDLIYSSSAYPHFSNPKLAFEKSIAALNDDGLLLIDSLSSQDCPSDYLRQLQEEHSEYIITTFDRDNPFYQAVTVERSKQD